jgi:hypothetical protein
MIFKGEVTPPFFVFGLKGPDEFSSIIQDRFFLASEASAADKMGAGEVSVNFEP